MPLTLTDLRHYAAHSECKRLETWQEQAAYIRRHSGATFRLLGEFFGVSHMAIQRLLKAFEDGRKPGVNPNKGRDHHPDGFTCLMAGAGVKAGQVYGTTTKDGQSAADDVLEVSDFNATIAWTLGIDPAFEEKSTSGRPFKLANHGEARKELFA